MRKLDASECDKCGHVFEEEEMRYREGLVYKPYHPIHGWVTTGSMQVYTGRIVCRGCAMDKRLAIRRKRVP